MATSGPAEGGDAGSGAAGLFSLNLPGLSATPSGPQQPTLEPSSGALSLGHAAPAAPAAPAGIGASTGSSGAAHLRLPGGAVKYEAPSGGSANAGAAAAAGTSSDTKPVPTSVLKDVSRVASRTSGERPPPLPFYLLHAQLCDPGLDAEAGARSLSEHIAAIIRVIDLPMDAAKKREPSRADTDVVYRPRSTLTDSQPTASDTEAAHRSFVQDELQISASEAGVLLRDFLVAARGEREAMRLLTSTDGFLVSAAPVDLVGAFRERERRFAFACAVKLFLYGSGIGTARFASAFAPLMKAHGGIISKKITDQVLALVQAHSSRRDQSAASLDPDWYGCVVEVFFVIVHCQGLASSDVAFLLNAIVDAAEKASSNRYLFRQTVVDTQHRAFLDGDRLTLLLSASFGSAFSAMQWKSDATDSTSKHALLPRRGKLVPFNVEVIQSIEASLQRLDGGIMFAELAIIRLMWGSCLATYGNSIDGISPGLDGVKHAEYAFAFESSSALRALLMSSNKMQAMDSCVEDALRIVFWSSLHLQLIGFSPAKYPRRLDEVEEDVNLAVAILSGCGPQGSEIASTQLWMHEYSESGRCDGTSALLRMASGIFPLRFLPFVSLLSELCTDADSAIEVDATLSKRMYTRMEGLMPHVKDALQVLSPAESAEVQRAARLTDHQDVHWFFNTITLISGSSGEGKSCLVRPVSDIPSSYGDTLFADTAIGLLAGDNSAITWACNWDGWSAISLALRSLLVFLSQPGAEAEYTEEHISQLISASLVALRLVERICLHGSKDMRQQFSVNFDSAELVCDIFVAAADPPMRNGAFISSSSRAMIMSYAGTCLHSLTLCMSPRAQSVVDRIVLSASRSNALQACVTALGISSFPALSAVAKIANTAMLGRSHFLTTSAVHDDMQVGPVRVLDFVRGIGLPLWLSVYNSGGKVTQSGKSSDLWLLPAASLELFGRCPKKMLDAPAVAAVASTTIVSIAQSSRGMGNTRAEPFLFVALHHAIALCIAVMECRNAALDDVLASNPDSVRCAETDLRSFERMLLEPEVVHALAVLASGAPEVMTSLEESIAAAVAGRRSDFASLCRFVEDRATSVENLQNLAAKCLSLFMTCLYKISKCSGNSIIQVPWPAMGHSSLGCWFGGGESIRHGFALRIAVSKDCAVADFIGTVVSCGQRAAARALFGPASGKPKSSSVEMATLTEGGARKENEMLSAVVDKLAASVRSWTKVVAIGGGEFSFFQKQSLGIATSSIAACVRILRTAWEVHGGVWLKEAWAALGVWKRLAGLLRCRSGHDTSGSDVFDLHVALRSIDKRESGHMSDDEPTIWTKESLQAAVDGVDIHATWRGIVSDVLGIFASEVVFRSTNLAELSTSVRTDTSFDGGNKSSPPTLLDEKTSQDVFDGDAFSSLRDSFTEQWMHLFLDTSCLSIIRSNILPLSETNLRQDSLEDATTSIDKELSRLCNTNVEESILSSCHRRDELRLNYGGNFAYSVPLVQRCLRQHGLESAATEVQSVIGRIVVLNVRKSRAESQLQLTRAFSALTTMIVMADSVAPVPTKMLTYASPQYCAKLCRVISHGMATSNASSISSPSILAIHVELAILLGFVSARLSPEELEQAALSAVRFERSEEDANDADVSQMSPIAKLASLVSRNAQLLRSSNLCNRERMLRLLTIRWLLLSGARLAAGIAFRSDRDVSALGDAALSALRAASTEPELCYAASVALSAVALTNDMLMQSSFGRGGSVDFVFSAIASLARLESEHSDDDRVSATAGLVLFMTKLASGFAGMGSGILLKASALEHLSSGSIAAMLPAATESVMCYNPLTLQREPVHRLWCGSLSLAASLISQVEVRVDSAAAPSSHMNGILEFAVSNASRMASVSLDSAGDWPPVVGDPDDAIMEVGRFRSNRHLTMARVEEAELVMETIFALSGHALDLRDALPHVVDWFIASSVRTVYQSYRLIRAEPIERWVRPVTEHERQRSETVRYTVDGSSGVISVGGAVNSPWAMSPVMSPSGGGGTGGGVGGGSGGGRYGSGGNSAFPGSTGGATGGNASGPGPSPRRTPQQALRAALGRLSSRGGSSSAIPPSPGMPSTPQHQSPMSVGTAVRSAGPADKYQSPLSPWGSTGGGLITGSGVYFAEEVTRSLLRCLAAALGALRRFSTMLDRPVFAATMTISEGEPSLGLLVGIQFHACSELQRGCEGERRDALVLMLENALVLSLAHAVHYSKHGELSVGVRDELHRRMETVVSRMRRLVPPCPSYSIVHTDVDSFLRHFKTA